MGFTPDFFISTTGSDSNPGTFVSPWAITAINTKRSTYAGKGLGLLPGTYGISSLMTTDAQNSARNPALNINGGPDTSNMTTICSCDASGIYSRGTVTIKANDNGTYGGQVDSTNAMIGCNDAVTNRGQWRVRGIKFTGFSLWALHVGSSPSGGVRITNWNFLECEFTDGNTTNATNSAGVNTGPAIIYSSNNPVDDTNYGFTDCYFHDNLRGGSNDSAHFSCCYTWGLAASGTTVGTTFYRCTIVNSGGLHGKEGDIEGTTVKYCYIDWTTNAPNSQNGSCIQGFDGFGGSRGTLTQTTKFHHNVLLCNYGPLDLQSELGGGGWVTPLEVYNNTIVAPSGVTGAMITYYENAAGAALLKWYNNIAYDNGAGLSGYGYTLVNGDAFAICDYNLWASLANKWNVVNNGAHDSISASTKTTFANWKTAIGSLDAHSSTTAPTFTNSGAFASQYLTTSGAAFQTGRMGGTSGGSVTNMGHDDGTGAAGSTWAS